MKRVTHRAECNCLSNLAKNLQPLPSDIVCNCGEGPAKKMAQPKANSSEYEIGTTCLTPPSVQGNCVSENEAEEFVSACDVREPVKPPRVKACNCEALKQNIPEKECPFYESPYNTSMCICESGCPLRQEIPTKESERISYVSLCRCSFGSPFADFDQKIPTKESEEAPCKPGEAPNYAACKCNFERAFPTKPTDTSCTCICNSGCPFKNTSLISSDSQDLMYVDRIRALIQKEKCLKQEIRELEHKEKAYADKMKEISGIHANEDVNETKRTLSIHNLYLQNQQMEEDNKNLEDRIKDVELDLKRVLENAEGPLKRDLERERRKCEQLENQIRDLVSKKSNVENKGRKEIEFLARQLENAKLNTGDLHLVNKRLREEVCVLCCKFNEMQNELINQKLGEVKLLNELSAKKKKQLSSCVCTGATDPWILNEDLEAIAKDPSIPKEDLEAIAKNLSQLLREAKQCSTCQTASPGVIDTVKCIKDLVNAVNPKKKKTVQDCTCTDGK